MLFVVVLATLGFDADGPAGQRLREEGRLQLGRLTEMSRLPASGVCWKDAVRRLHVSCDGLNSDAQASVALRLTDCFLETSGRAASGCGDSADRVRCTATMTPEAFHAYTVFYTHAQSICFFLRGELWHEETERTIERLAAASAQVSFHMEAVSRVLDVSHENIMLAITELQSWSLGEVSWFRGVAFYLAALVAALVVSASPRTVGARPWLCLVLTLNLAVEYCVLSWVVSHFGGTVEEQSLRGKAWASLSRKVSVAICVVLTVAKMLLYRDYPSENNRLLLELRTDTTKLLGELRQTEGKPNTAFVTEETTVEPEVYEEPLRVRPKFRPFIREHSPYRKFHGSYNYGKEQLQRSSTPLSDVDVSDVSLLTKRDFYTPERQLPNAHSTDPRLNAIPVVVIRPIDLGNRGRRESSVGSNVSTHSYSLRSVQHQ